MLDAIQTLTNSARTMKPSDFANVMSASDPDWDRERVRQFWDPGRKLIRAIRRYQAARERASIPARLSARFWQLNHWVWSLLTQCDIPLNVQIEGGLILPHPTGIVIHPDCRIGPNCLIFQHVTLANSVHLGGHCDIGTGAVLIGPLTLGDHVQVGANAVVTKDFNSRTLIGGLPAKVIAD